MNPKKLTPIALLFAMILLSCNSLIKEKKIEVGAVSISGEGDKYIKVVPDTYTLKAVEDKIVIPIKLELLEKYKGKSIGMDNLNLIPLDKDGSAVADIGLNMRPATTGEWSKISDLLKGDVGKTVTINFQWDYFSDKKTQKRIMKEMEGFELVEADFTGGDEDNKATTATTVTEDKGSAGSSDFDKMLNDYQEYVDSYVKFYRKAAAGDQDALSQYPEMMEKALALQTSLAKAQSAKSLSSAQAMRMLKIQTKMTTIMTENK